MKTIEQIKQEIENLKAELRLAEVSKAKDLGYKFRYGNKLEKKVK